MSVVEPLPLGHAVQFALSRSLQVGNPIVVFPLEQLVVELCTLFLPKRRCGIEHSRLSIYLKSFAPLGQELGLQVLNLFEAPTQELGRGLVQDRSEVSTPPPHVLERVSGEEDNGQ